MKRVRFPHAVPPMPTPPESTDPEIELEIRRLRQTIFRQQKTLGAIIGGLGGAVAGAYLGISYVENPRMFSDFSDTITALVNGVLFSGVLRSVPAPAPAKPVRVKTKKARVAKRAKKNTPRGTRKAHPVEIHDDAPRQ